MSNQPNNQPHNQQIIQPNTMAESTSTNSTNSIVSTNQINDPDQPNKHTKYAQHTIPTNNSISQTNKSNQPIQTNPIHTSNTSTNSIDTLTHQQERSIANQPINHLTNTASHQVQHTNGQPGKTIQYINQTTRQSANQCIGPTQTTTYQRNTSNSIQPN